MQVNWNDKSYSLDVDEIEVEEARVFKRFDSRFTLKGWEAAMEDGDADAMTCLYWLMLRQNGENHAIDRLSFKVIKFAKAIAEAQEAENPEEPEAAPKDDAPVRPSKRSASSKATSSA